MRTKTAKLEAKKSNESRNVVSLVCVSGAKQAADDKTGLPRQREDIEIHCQAHNLVNVREFALEGISGTKVQNSKEYRELLKEVAKPSCAGIAFATVDRFFRPENIGTFSDVWKPLYQVRNGDLKIFCDLGCAGSA
jgi:hypothetical protein